MGDSDASSISSIPLGQCDQASTEKIASDDSPDKFDIILKHIQRLDDELKEVKKDRHEILKACASKTNPITASLSPPPPVLATGLPGTTLVPYHVLYLQKRIWNLRLDADCTRTRQLRRRTW